MDKEWSEKNKRMQTLLNKKDTMGEALRLLIELRTDISGNLQHIFTYLDIWATKA